MRYQLFADLSFNFYFTHKNLRYIKALCSIIEFADVKILLPEKSFSGIQK